MSSFAGGYDGIHVVGFDQQLRSGKANGPQVCGNFFESKCAARFRVDQHVDCEQRSRHGKMRGSSMTISLIAICPPGGKAENILAKSLRLSDREC